MSKPVKRQSTTLDVFDIEAQRLRKKNCRFRMFRRQRERVIKIRDYGPVWEGERKDPLEFSAPFRWQDENHHIGPEEKQSIEQCAQMCIDSERNGRWLGETIDWRASPLDGHIAADGLISWPSFIKYVRDFTWENVTNEGTRKNYRGPFNEMANWTGPVTSARIEAWVYKTDPDEELGAWVNKRSIVGKMVESKAMPGLKDLHKEMGKDIDRLKGGQGKKQKNYNRLEPRAIPKDGEFEKWFDSFPPELENLRTIMVMIAVYGLRPHEVWHIDWLRESGIAHLEFGKTGERVVQPVPTEWVTKYDLPNKWKQAQAWMRENSKIFAKPWPTDAEQPVFLPGDRLIPWVAVIDNVRNCWNSFQLGEQIAVWLQRPGVPELWGKAEKKFQERGDGYAKARSYDPRHAFAIRCFDHPETIGEETKVFADWMGHSTEVHESTYLRWMPI